MSMSGDDLDAAFYLCHRFIDPMRTSGRPVNQVLEKFCQKVDLLWNMSADGLDVQDAAEESVVLHEVADVAQRLGVTERQVRRLADQGHIEARKFGRIWLFKEAAVTDYLKRRNGAA